MLGGLLAFGAAGLAAWQGALAYLAAPGAMRTFGPNAMSAYGFGAVAVALGSLALWLIVSPPRGKTRLVALCAAVVAAPLPAWLLIGPILGQQAGLGAVDPGGWLALPAGLGRVFGVETLAALAPATVAAELKIGTAVALGIGLVASLYVLFSRSESRGAGLAGLALACVLVWSAGFSVALVPPGAGKPDASGPASSRATAEPDASGPASSRATAEPDASGPAASSPDVSAPPGPFEGGGDAAGALPESGPAGGTGPDDSAAPPAPPAEDEPDF